MVYRLYLRRLESLTICRCLYKGSTPQLLKDPGCCSGQDLNQRPPAQQTNTYPVELAGWWLIALQMASAFNSLKKDATPLNTGEICKQQH